MRVRQIDLLDRTIRLEPGTTKNKQGRAVKMTEEIYLWVSQGVRGKGPDDFVFTCKDGQRIKDFRGLWEKVTAATSVPGLLVHDLRQSAVRNMIRRGIPEVVAMRISGPRSSLLRPKGRYHGPGHILQTRESWEPPSSVGGWPKLGYSDNLRQSGAVRQQVDAGEG